MKAPWANKTGAAKVAVWSATVLGVSLGLCGANVVGLNLLFKFRGSGSWTSIVKSLDFGLTLAAYLEFGGILVGAVGLLVAVLFGLVELTIYLTKKRDF